MNNYWLKFFSHGTSQSLFKYFSIIFFIEELYPTLSDHVCTSDANGLMKPIHACSAIKNAHRFLVVPLYKIQFLKDIWRRNVNQIVIKRSPSNISPIYASFLSYLKNHSRSRRLNYFKEIFRHECVNQVRWTNTGGTHWKSIVILKQCLTRGVRFPHERYNLITSSNRIQDLTILVLPTKTSFTLVSEYTSLTWIAWT